MLRQRVHSGCLAERDFDSFLLDQSLPNQVCCFLFHAPFVAVVSETRKIVGCDDAELAQIGECLRLGLTQVIGSIAVVKNGASLFRRNVPWTTLLDFRQPRQSPTFLPLL